MDNLVIILAGVAAISVLALAVVVLRRPKDDGQQRGETLALMQTLEQLRQTTAALDTNQKIIGDRLDGLQKRVGDGFQQHTERTGQTLQQLGERLAVIDQAQKTITDLSQQMVSLQDILSNKQARGAFGEIQLNDLVGAALPPSAYQLQATLENGKRVDCLLNLPNPPGPIAIDAKFPLESFQMLRDAEDEAAKVAASRAFTQAVKKHVTDIAERYIVPGATADSALMFLPSEAIYAELHANHRNIVEESFRRRVWIVSPTTLMATLNTVRAVLKDARMKEQAGLIQQEVHKLMDDMGRLDDRVGKLRTHFDQASKDIGLIETSARKIMSRGEKIETIELGDDTGSPAEDLAPREVETPADPQDRLKLV
ncbi:MAG: DNA recombination protein RmuC [Rhodospirillales bacterium]